MAKEPAENTSEFDLGDFVEGKKFANFEHDFKGIVEKIYEHSLFCLLYTSPSPRDGLLYRMPSSAWKKKKSHLLLEKKKLTFKKKNKTNKNTAQPLKHG